MLSHTVAAVSTPRGKGGVAMIRISGPDALSVAERVFVPKNSNMHLGDHPRTAVYGTLYATDPRGNREAVDDGVALFYRGPASFTGEDTVELTCHGGVLLTSTVLSAVLAAGAKPAEAGEFTKRAFLNGKLGLSAAAALGQMLEAGNRSQLTLAYNGLGGRVEKRVEEIYQRIARILAAVYVRIDYPDEDLADMTREEMMESLAACADDVEALARTYRTGHAVGEGIATVICGRPNAGKSSLYNRILGRDAAIVTDVEGTTRDVLTDTASLGGVTLRLCDTAGLRETDDPVEMIGVSRAKEELVRAELVLAVFDGSTPPTEEDTHLIQSLSALPACRIALVNKSDLRESKWEAHYREHFAHVIPLSAKTGEGMEALEEKIKELFLCEELDLSHDPILTEARQMAAALSAGEALRRCLAALKGGMELDLCCTDAEEAMSALSEIDGRQVTEDIVAQIFSRFCVGK